MLNYLYVKGGLSDIGEQLDVTRIGPEHQAGSDSILTAMIFFKMVKVYFEDHLDDDQYAGQLYGLGANKWVQQPQRMEVS